MGPSKNKEEFLEQFLSPERASRLDEILKARTSKLTVVLDSVHHAHNISAVIRSADAFGIRDVHLIGGGTEFSRGVALGAERWVQIHQHENVAAALLALKDFKLVILEPQIKNPRAVPVFELPFSESLALVFGNEKRGVHQEIVDAATYSAFIPMLGFVDSLNISVAAAITMFCSTMSGASGMRQPETLSAEEQAALRPQWLTQSVNNAERILKAIEDRN